MKEINEELSFGLPIQQTWKNLLNGRPLTYISVNPDDPGIQKNCRLQLSTILLARTRTSKVTGKTVFLGSNELQEDFGWENILTVSPRKCFWLHYNLMDLSTNYSSNNADKKCKKNTDYFSDWWFSKVPRLLSGIVMPSLQSTIIHRKVKINFCHLLLMLLNNKQATK